MNVHRAAPQPICRITANSLRRLVLVVALVGAGSSIAAEPSAAAVAPAAKADAFAPYELGEGLGYVRVRKLADTLPLLDRTLSQGATLVIDLRYPTISGDDVPALALALAQRSPTTPLFVLVSPQTPAALVPVLAKLPPAAVTLGVAESLPTPAVVVAQPADVDRRAYDARESGMPLEALITGKIEKERFDEAELVKEFENGHADAAPPAEPDPSKPADKAPVLTDRVLQRAVHLHRALAALKRG